MLLSRIAPAPRFVAFAALAGPAFLSPSAAAQGTNPSSVAANPPPAAKTDAPSLVNGWIGIALIAVIGYGVYRKLRAKGVDPQALIGKLVVEDARQAPTRDQASTAPPLPALDDLPAPSMRPSAPERPAAPARLQAIGGPGGGTSATLVDGFLIGRAPQCHLVIEEDSVSREHAAIHHSPEAGWVVADRSSSNGTWLNGRRIDQPTALRQGDTLQIGASRFRFEGGA